MSEQKIDYKNYYNRYLEKVKQAAAKAVKKATADAYESFFKIVEERIQDIFKSVIQDFYSDYTPDYYDRSESLYNLLQTSAERNSLSISFEPDLMTGFRSGYTGEDGLYDQVFRKGWHGGAGSGNKHPREGVPYWRTPIPRYSRWGREASVATLSPLEDMRQRVSDYERSEMISDFKGALDAHMNNITIDI